MKFRPCIDIHNGKVKQIVGGSLKDEGNQAITNFASEYGADFYAEMYKKDELVGGHIILLNPTSSEYYGATKTQALKALSAYPNGLQIGGGITADNAKITDNSKTGAVQVTALSVTDGAYKVGSYDSFSGSKTIALKINSCVTKGAGKMSITKDAFPKIGAAQNLPLTYFAKVSGDAPNSKDVQAANVVFTISIVG